MTRIMSIFERIGLGGGGKVKAVYHRMNALAEMEAFDPVLLNLDHSPRQLLNFAALQENGTLAPRVRMLTVPQACHGAAVDAGGKPFAAFPKADQTDVKRGKTVHYREGLAVMVDRIKQTDIGPVIKRTVSHPQGEMVFTLMGGEVHQMVQRRADGTVETTDYAKSIPIRWFRSKNRAFEIGKNLITGQFCRTQRVFTRNLFEMADVQDGVMFFDGVTSAYLAPATKAKRALFLHADHRGPEGGIVPRSKFLIENFDGEAIITSTSAHKAQIEQDVTPSAPVHVVPHFCETDSVPAYARAHLVTVSRLELVGKPIDECIGAFCRIKDEFPQVDYVIYGLGAGQQQLEKQIEALGCAERVKLAGYTNDPLEVFRHAAASIYPTTTEGFGLSILEALSNGCPVLSYDVNYGPREMIKTGINGELVARGDIAAIADAMRRILRRPAQYQQGTCIGLERYSRHAYLANYRDLMTALAQVSRAG